MSCIDWHKQWELHTPNFSDGLAHIPLQSKQGKIKKFSLLPGAGFGDLSHPTTKLMLEMMPQKIEGEMIDIGCGSAILSIAGALRGAKKVIGLEVDPSAILHAKENVKWNQLENSITIQTTLTSAHELQKPLLLLMNMISSEQKIAWGSLSFLHAMPKTLIV
ncbi:MAG: 50S ribosomal protein L11 methyltransferase, partial [Simkania negevensis]|nr:50S ribosomal protein L11 methyltransferase [Simkania negevensis]